MSLEVEERESADIAPAIAAGIADFGFDEACESERRGDQNEVKSNMISAH